MRRGETPGGRRLFGAGVRPFLPLLGLALFALVASVWPAPFVLDRTAVDAGEWWRLFTGHFVHASRAHFLFDVGVGCVLLLFVSWRRSALLLPPFVAWLVLGLRSDLDVYTGLSGVLHGMTVLAAVDVARRGDVLERIVGVGVLVGVIAKAIYEASLGVSVFTSTFDMGGATVYEAHLIGVLGGLLLAATEALVDLPGRTAPARLARQT